MARRGSSAQALDPSSESGHVPDSRRRDCIRRSGCEQRSWPAGRAPWMARVKCTKALSQQPARAKGPRMRGPFVRSFRIPGGSDRDRMSRSITDLAAAMAAAWSAGKPEQVTARHAQAAATFRRLTRMRPQVSAYWNNLGVACRLSGDTAASERALLKAGELAPDDAEVHYNLGLLYLQLRHWPRAREALLDAVRLSPRFIDARLQAAYACHVCGDNGGEEAMLEGAAGWPPQPAGQALILAAMLSTLGRPD